MKSARPFFLGIATLLMATLALAQERSPALPDTPAGKVGALFLEAFRGADTAHLTSLIESTYSTDALKQTPTKKTVAFLQKIQQGGGFEVMAVSPDSNERFLVLDLRSLKSSDRWYRMYFALSRQEPGKLNEIGVFPMKNPAEEKATVFPTHEMGEAAVVNEIAKYIDREVTADRFSGTVLIDKRGRKLVHRGFGFAEKSFRVPNKPDTKYNLGSMNKMFTSVAIGQLMEQNKLALTDTIAKLLPDYPNRAAAEQITVEQLLSHRSGLGDFFDHPEFRPHREDFRNPTDYFPLFANDPPRFAPGSRFAYSNAGFIVLGAIIERLSGENYFDYVKKHIFVPAGMTDTDSYELTQVVPNLAVGYGRFEDDPLGLNPRRANIAFLPWQGSPAGGGYSTAPDLLKFANALRAHKLLSPATTELFTTRKTPMTGSPRRAHYGYGFSMSDLPRDKEVFGHSGGGGNSGINSSMEIFRDGSYTVIVVGNYDSPAAEDLARKISEFLAQQ